MGDVKLIVVYSADVDALQSELAELREELADMQRWRDLALQFDHHRMSALWHLKTLVLNPGYSPAVTDFLAEPPLPAHEVVQRLTAVKQRNADLLAIMRSVRLNANPKLFSIGQLERIDELLAKSIESGASE